MKSFKLLTVTSTLSIGLAISVLQSANAADTGAVQAAGQKSAQNALSRGWEAHIATCRIAVEVRRAAIAAGFKKGTPEYQTVVRNTVYNSARNARSDKGLKIKGLLNNNVVLDCKKGGGGFLPIGLLGGIGLPGAAAIGVGGLLGISAIANLTNDDTPDSSDRNLSAE